MNNVAYSPNPVTRRMRMRSAIRDWAVFFTDDCECRFCRAYREFYDISLADIATEPELEMPNMGEFVD